MNNHRYLFPYGLYVILITLRVRRRMEMRPQSKPPGSPVKRPVTLSTPNWLQPGLSMMRK